MSRTSIAACLAAAAGVFVAGVVHALPQRTLVARPLPPGVLAAAEAGASGTTLDAATARRLTDSLLTNVSAVRDLKALRTVPVQAASRAQIRARLEEITRQDAIEAQLKEEEKRLEFLGLVPADLDLVKLYHDLLEEQLAGFYDIDKREMVLADWISPEQTSVVMSHELAHALQDQHFSLRVRKRLGFDSPDVEAAWHALIEGDATAVMAELALAPSGKHFTALADSATASALLTPVARAVAGGFDSQRFRAAPALVREELSFPYVQGLRYVTELYRTGGWKAVDAAYIHPPASTEQILHPERIDNIKDAPIRVTVPDLRGLLGDNFQPAAAGVLGEHELLQYLSHYVDPEVARASAEGWGGCSYALYDGGPGEPSAFALVSVWDSEDDAVEFFGGLIGVLEARYPKQEGSAESSSQDQVIWNLDKDGKRVNVLRLHDRQVMCLEAMPGPRLMRVISKLDTGVEIQDPAPEMRARQKENLAWNRRAAPVQQGALRPRVTLPAGWTQVEAPDADTLAIFAAVNGKNRLELVVDRGASNELGLDGYAHAVAANFQSHGKNVYVQTDVDFPRESDTLYQHIFMQDEGNEKIAYYLGVANLRQGLGYLWMRGPADDDTTNLERTFYELLGNMELLPENDAAPAVPTAPAASDSAVEPKG